MKVLRLMLLLVAIIAGIWWFGGTELGRSGRGAPPPPGQSGSPVPAPRATTPEQELCRTVVQSALRINELTPRAGTNPSAQADLEMHRRRIFEAARELGAGSPESAVSLCQQKTGVFD